MEKSETWVAKRGHTSSVMDNLDRRKYGTVTPSNLGPFLPLHEISQELAARLGETGTPELAEPGGAAASPQPARS